MSIIENLVKDNETVLSDFIDETKSTLKIKISHDNGLTLERCLLDTVKEDRSRSSFTESINEFNEILFFDYLFRIEINSSTFSLKKENLTFDNNTWSFNELTCIYERNKLDINYKEENILNYIKTIQKIIKNINKEIITGRTFRKNNINEYKNLKKIYKNNLLLLTNKEFFEKSLLNYFKNKTKEILKASCINLLKAKTLYFIKDDISIEKILNRKENIEKYELTHYLVTKSNYIVRNSKVKFIYWYHNEKDKKCIEIEIVDGELVFKTDFENGIIYKNKEEAIEKENSYLLNLRNIIDKKLLINNVDYG